MCSLSSPPALPGTSPRCLMPLPRSPRLSPTVCTEMCFKEPGGAWEEGDGAVGRGSPGRAWPWAPATASWGRKSNPRWMSSSLNQATIFTFQASGKAVPLSHANIFIYLNRGGNILLPSHRFWRNLASPESKQPPACFYTRPKRSLQRGV